eukprot:635324-Pyramimonas_sp.AAC.1
MLQRGHLREVRELICVLLRQHHPGRTAQLGRVLADVQAAEPGESADGGHLHGFRGRVGDEHFTA